MRLHLLVSVLPALAVLPSVAQGPARPDPLDAAAPVPRAVYASPFAGPRASEARVGSWVAANEQVARVGGWRVYAREASRPEPGASAPAAAADSQHRQHGPGGPGR